MRIIHVIDDLNETAGGPAQACIEMAASVARKGHRVAIYALGGRRPAWFPRSGPLPPARTAGAGRWVRASLFAALSFMLLNGVSDISFAGSPGYELLLFLCAVAAAERLARSDAPDAEAIGLATPVWGGRAAPAVA